MNKNPQDRYKQIDSYIGQGAYGKVEKACDLVDDEVVAIKKVKVEQNAREATRTISEYGVDVTVLREIKICRELHHLNIMTIKDVFVDGDFIHLVMPYMLTDLAKLLRARVAMTVSHQKCILGQILNGVKELHANWFLHRDLAPANVFIDSRGVCKVGDFGLARQYASPLYPVLTPRVVTLWYRAPELLFGAVQYHGAVDLWSVGCIFAEMLANGKPFLPGKQEYDQLGKIFGIFGTPNSKNKELWPDVESLPLYKEFEHSTPKKLSTIFPGVSHDALDLLTELMTLDPLKRPSAEKALAHHYFVGQPPPCLPEELPIHTTE